MWTKRLLKFLHTMAAAAMVGSLIAHIVLLTVAPAPTSLEAYAALRTAIGALASWILLPALGVVLLSGILSMALVPAFRAARWAWMKTLLGVSVFEGTLVSVQGPAVRSAEATAAAVAGDLDPAVIETLVRGEWGSLWVILALAVINVVLGVWRPRLLLPIEIEVRRNEAARAARS